MILNELQKILEFLKQVRNYDAVEDNMIRDDCDECIWLIEREIKLRTMDVRK